MRNTVNETHDPRLTSWVASANEPDTDFPVQNLPFGVYRTRGSDEEPRIGVAIGDSVLDLCGCSRGGFLRDRAEEAALACTAGSLNALMALGPGQWSALRARLSAILRQGSPDRHALKGLLSKRQNVELLLPCEIGDYTDFYASVHHATNVGRMFRPDTPLLPNYKYIPIGYHGRSSSIAASGTPVRRPKGQTKAGPDSGPTFAPTGSLDYEVEVGCFIGGYNAPGCLVPIDEAENRMFGVCILNDWSARDIQKWEYQPLGPFLAKDFATAISPWVVTMEALAPFRVPLPARPSTDPAPLPYLSPAHESAPGGIDIILEVYLCSARMREQGIPPAMLSRGNFRDMYWTFAQMLTHHASNGCNLRPGDLLGSGTVSGPTSGSYGCLLELSGGGSAPLSLPGGETRRFLQDGDEVLMRGYCVRSGFRTIGMGECRGTILPPLP